MARRGESLLELLSQFPWWVSVALSAAAYVGLRFVLPLFIPAGPATSANFATKGFLGGVSAAAPLVALVLLIPAAIAAVREWSERLLLDKQQDLASIRALSWRRFETLVAEAYRRQGYAVSRPSGNGPDGGVDLVLKKNGNTTLVQCKQWKTWKVGVKVVREVFGVMTARHAQGAIVVTSGMFTQEARAFAAGKPMDLIEGHQLAELIQNVQGTPASGTPATQRPSLTPSKAAPVHAQRRLATPPATSGKVCPKCGAPMVLRTAQKGSGAGQQFWGCSTFPRCRATAPVTEGKAQRRN